MEPFENLIQIHGEAVWRVCRALVPPNDVDDAWQETFLAALRAYRTGRPVNPRAWLIGIAHNKCADIHRRRYREPIAITDPGAHLDPVPPPQEPNPVWEAVARLSQKQRQVIAYRYLADLTYRQIAGILGGTEAAARRAGADGMKNLRAMMSLEFMEVEEE